MSLDSTTGPAPARKIGIMGGTFDPIHYGHLFLAEEARIVCGLERVLFVPNGQPAHAEGKSTWAPAEVRYQLTQEAIAGNAAFSCSRIELDRPGKSYAYDTVLALQNELGPEVQLSFIAGADSLRDILTWYRGAELLQLVHFIAASRPGYDGVAALQHLAPHQRERVTFLEIPGLHIASRDLRARVAAGLPIRYLTPDGVCQRIEALRLYREESAPGSTKEAKP